MGIVLRWILVVIAVAGLAVDAWTHLDLAPQFALNRTSTLSEATLFRIEAALAIAAAVLLVLRQNVLTVLFAAAVAGGGAFLLVLYRYVDVGRLGPVPDLYEPIWFREKVESLIGELVALAASLALLALLLVERYRSSRRAPLAAAV